ncbi:MAG TPA: hypothetical protein VLF94_04235, partial [Chlamydiales bacterium]|nr:hypothetical protein [Chlamydiales bacterium]
MLRSVMLLCLWLPMMTFGWSDKPEDKIYVELDDLVFDSSGIWYRNPVDSSVARAQAIHFD